MIRMRQDDTTFRSTHLNHFFYLCLDGIKEGIRTLAKEKAKDIKGYQDEILKIHISILI